VVLHSPRLALLQTTDAWFDTCWLDQLQVVIVDFEFQLWGGFLSHSDMTCPMFLRNTLKDGKEV
jgi:hypothetical protein